MFPARQRENWFCETKRSQRVWSVISASSCSWSSWIPFHEGKETISERWLKHFHTEVGRDRHASLSSGSQPEPAVQRPLALACQSKVPVLHHTALGAGAGARRLGNFYRWRSAGWVGFAVKSCMLSNSAVLAALFDHGRFLTVTRCSTFPPTIICWRVPFSLNSLLHTGTCRLLYSIPELITWTCDKRQWLRSTQHTSSADHPPQQELCAANNIPNNCKCYNWPRCFDRWNETFPHSIP